MKIKPFELQVFEAAVNEFGVDSQLDVAAEECAELIQAIIKLGRTQRGQYWKGSRKPSLEDKAHENLCAKRVQELVEEVGDVQMMLNQIRFMVPGEYAEAYEGALHKFAQELENRGHRFNVEASP